MRGPSTETCALQASTGTEDLRCGSDMPDANVMLSGGNMMFEGMAERIQKAAKKGEAARSAVVKCIV